MEIQQHWDTIFNEGKDFRPMNQILLGRILEFVKLTSSPKTALDIGCGTGDLVVKLSKAGLDVTGIDVSKVALEKAQKRVSEAGINVTLHQFDIANPAFSKTFIQPFDLIFCKLVYAFVPDKNAFLNTVKNLLSENSSFILITPVLYKGIEYDKRLMGISVDYEETFSLLKQHFKSVIMFNESLVDEKEGLITFIAKK